MIRNIAKTLLKTPLKNASPLFAFNQSKKPSSPFIVNDDKTSQIISGNYGMNKYLMRVYNTTGLSILGALGTAFMASSSPIILANIGATAIMGCIMTLGGFISASYMKPTTVT